MNKLTCYFYFNQLKVYCATTFVFWFRVQFDSTNMVLKLSKSFIKLIQPLYWLN